MQKPLVSSKDIEYLSKTAVTHAWPGQEAYDDIDSEELDEDSPRAPDGPVFSINKEVIEMAAKKKSKAPKKMPKKKC